MKKNIADKEQIKKLKEFLEELDIIQDTEGFGLIELVAEKDPSFIWAGRVLQLPLPRYNTFKLRDLVVSEIQEWAQKRDLYANGYIYYLHAPLLMITLRYNAP